MATSKKDLPEGTVAIENFFGVYLLYCTNPKYKGRTYIGFTVDPNRRINQHNIGKKAGGAWKTSQRGPWEMVLIIHGFLDDIAALKFEWAWQHPERSRHLRNCPTTKKSTEQLFLFNLRVLAEMLSVGPWNRLPLTIQWLIPSFEKPFPAHRSPPFHMSICYGRIFSVKSSCEKPGEEKKSKVRNMCWICTDFDDGNELLSCLQPSCSMVAHTVCLSKTFLEKEPTHIMPIEGVCPRCNSKVLWGDLIRKKRGCYINFELMDTTVLDTSTLDSY